MYNNNYKKRKRASYTDNRLMDISILLDKVLEKANIVDDINFKEISEHFSEIIGESVLPYVKLIKIEKKTLFIKAINSAWKQELFLQKKMILKKCNEYLSNKIIHDVIII